MRENFANILIVLAILSIGLSNLGCKRAVETNHLGEGEYHAVTKEFKSECDEFNYIIDMALDIHITKGPENKEFLYKEMLQEFNKQEVLEIAYTEENLKKCAHQTKLAKLFKTTERSIIHQSLSIFMSKLDPHSKYFPPSDFDRSIFKETAANTGTQISLRFDPKKDMETSFWVNEKIGYIRLKNFFFDVGLAFKIAFQVFKAQGEMLGLILDIRENNGGFISEFVKVISRLLKAKGIKINDLLITEKGRVSKEKIEEHLSENPPQEKYYLETPDEPQNSHYDKPLLLLVDNYSMSAAEMLDGALDDHNNVVIMGDSFYVPAEEERVATFGKGTGQTMPIKIVRGPLKGLAMITAFHWYTPEGFCVQKKGYPVHINSKNLSNFSNKGIKLEKDYKDAVTEGANISNSEFESVKPPMNDLIQKLEKYSNEVSRPIDTVELAKKVMIEWLRLESNL